MIAINSINRFLTPGFRFRNKPVARVPVYIRNLVKRGIKHTTRNFSNPVFSITRLPKNLVIKMKDIFRHISTRAHQSAELRQTFKKRELLQSEIKKDISKLKTVFEQLSKDDLKLFIALFQNRSLTGPANSGSSQNSLIPNLSLDGFIQNFPKSLFQIDVTSEFGTLAALNLSGIVIDALTERDSRPGLPNFLLYNLADSNLNLAFLERTGRDTGSATTAQNRNIALLFLQSQYFLPYPINSNPITIIDLVG